MFLFFLTAFQETVSNAVLQVHSPEDSFIGLMAMGRIVVRNVNNHLEAASLEGLVAELIEASIKYTKLVP